MKEEPPLIVGAGEPNNGGAANPMGYCLRSQWVKTDPLP